MLKTIDTVRERERERYNLKNKVTLKRMPKQHLMLTSRFVGQSGERELQFRKIGFICCAKNKLNRYIERIGYKKSEAAKLKIAYPFITKTCT